MLNLPAYRAAIADRFAKRQATNGKHITALMAKYGVDDANIAYEIAEHEWVRSYREIAKDDSIRSILDFYNNVQPTFAVRDSTRVALQQYSTSAPVAFLANRFVKDGRDDNIKIFEPSAGNGLLTIGFKTEQVHVNEIDKPRLTHLKMDNYTQTTNFDSSIAANMRPYFRLYDGIISNPPFGKMPDAIDKTYGDYLVKKLDHVMALLALECMKDDGRAAIIIGGWTDFKTDDFGGRSVSDRKYIMKQGNKTYKPNASIAEGEPFFNYLYNHYNVIDILNIDSDEMYHRQGTTFPLRMILIAGRKKGISIGEAPKYKDVPHLVNVISDFNVFNALVNDAQDRAAKIENGEWYDPTLVSNILKNAITYLQNAIF
jgi:predicted RNA methylase